MVLKGNIGEWSEVYTFFKLLAEGELFSADGQLNKIYSLKYPIKKVFRDDAPDRVEYTIDSMKHHVLIAGQSKSIIVPQSEFSKAASLFLQKYKDIKKNQGTFPEIEIWMKKVLIDKISAKSQDKADIRLVIHNFQNGVEAELGYSIKSKLGGMSTLINANKDNSNFIYQVKNGDALQIISRQNTEDKKTRSWLTDKLSELYKEGGHLEFLGIGGSGLYSNLIMLDLGMPLLIASLLSKSYVTKNKNIAELTSIISDMDPLHIGEVRNAQPIYEYKVKQFLLAFALGMTVSTPWNGSFNANGGYIVVKEDGDVVCYHFFDRQQLEDYLFYNTAFDTPSTTRHGFGDFYMENGKLYIKLNLQIRFLL